MENKIPTKYLTIWNEVSNIIKSARPGDYEHALDLVREISSYDGSIKIDLDILVPVAMMHDIGHSAILSEHFAHITGPKKLINGKLVHMLAGAKIAKDVLSKINYPESQITEVVDIISVHDADQLEGVVLDEWYDTENKKIFHDFDSLDRFTEKRINFVRNMYPDREKLLEMLEKSLNSFFFGEFKEMARGRFEKLI